MKMQDFHNVLNTRSTRDQSKSQKELLVRFHLLGRAISMLELQSIDKEVFDETSYHFVPIPPCIFADIVIEAFHALGMDQSHKFLDVGCGIGTTVLMAGALFDAHGIDIDPELIEKSRPIVGERTEVADALTFERYNEFDFLYWYRPFFDPELYTRFETKIYNELKSGGVVCSLWSMFDWEAQPDIERVGEFIYQKQ